MVKYTSSVLAAANLLALAQALPAQPVCSVIVQYVTGQGVWVPQADPTWGSWDPSTSKTPVATSTASWSAWEDPSKPKTTTKSTTSADWNTWDPSKNTKTTTKSTTTSAEWASWTSSASVSAKTTTTTSKFGGGFYTSSKETTSAKPTTYSSDFPTTTAKPTTSAKPSTTTASTTTTTAVEQPAATCPYYDQSYHFVGGVTVGGSCGGSYDINCGARVTSLGPSTKFWQRADEIIETLEECLQICDENAECTATFWTNYSGASAADYKHCYQTNGLPQPDLKGGENQYAQLSYKTSTSGNCASSYINN